MPRTGPNPVVERLLGLGLLLLLLLSASAMVLGAEGELVGDLRDGLPAALWQDHWTLQQMKDLSWPGHALSVHWPGGADAMVVAGGPLTAALAAPFVLALGYPGFWNPFVVFCLVCNGLASAWLARRLGASPVGWVLAGLAFALSPALLREASSGAQHVFFAAPLPLAIGLGLQGLGGTRRQALLAGAATVLASLAWWPYGLLTGGLMLVLGAWRLRRSQDRHQTLDRLGWMARAWVPGLAMLLPLLASRLRAADHAAPLSQLPDALADIEGARMDFALGAATSLPPGRLVALSDQPGEILASLLVLVLLLLWFQVMGRRQLVWPALLVAAALASLGAWLSPSWDLSDGWLPLPLAWAQAWMPGLDGITRPQRFMVFGALASSMMLAVLWTQLAPRWSERSRKLGGAAATLLLLSLPWAQGVAPLQSSAWEPPDWIHALDQPGAVIAVPLGWTDRMALWQPLHGHPVAGGPGEVKAYASSTPTRQLFEERPELRALWMVEGARLGEEELRALDRTGARWVVVDAALVDLVVESDRDLQAWSLPVLATRIDEALGPAVYSKDGVRVYRIPVLGEAP